MVQSGLDGGLSAFVTSPAISSWTIKRSSKARSYVSDQTYRLSARISRAATRSLAADFCTLSSSTRAPQRLGDVGDRYSFAFVIEGRCG
jgi:hypothetical protein